LAGDRVALRSILFGVTAEAMYLRGIAQEGWVIFGYDQFAMMRDMQKGMMTQMIAQMGKPPDALSGVEAMQEEVTQVVAHDLSWEATKASYTGIYASTFSESRAERADRVLSQPGRSRPSCRRHPT